MNIVILDGDTLGDDVSLEQLKTYGNVQKYPDTQPDEVLSRIKDADIVLTNKVKLGEKEFSASERLKYVGVLATGMNNIDLNAAERQNIHVRNVENYSTNSVAQHTYSLILALLNQVTEEDKYIRSGSYSNQKVFNHIVPSFRELKGMTLGIIGMGNIGQKVAKLAIAFEMEVIYHSTSGRNLNQPYLHVSLGDILTKSDIITIHCGLNEHTHHLISYEELKLMRKDAYLLNTGRGGIVNEKDLVKALDEKLIKGAGIDVFENEPLPADHPYLSMNRPDSLILTPHMAWSSVEARQQLIDLTCNNIKEYLETVK